MSEVTKILDAVKSGERDEAEKLLPAAYQELRRMARQLMASERTDHTLQPTALLHEAYLRLTGPDGEQPDWDSPAHFFSSASEAMRRVLIDSARRKWAKKRGGEQVRTTFDEDKFESPLPSEELLAIDEALTRLEAENPRAAEVVKLRYYAGMTVPEAAAALDLSPRTVDRNWLGAKAWLHRELQG